MSGSLRPRIRGYPRGIEGRPVITFDEASGQQYTEVLSRPSPMRADWVWKSTGSTQYLASYTSKGSGCESLVDMAIRTVLRNLAAISYDILEPLPWQVGKLIWEEIRLNQLDSLYVWRAFVGAYSGQVERRSVKYRRQVIERPDMDLSVYVKHITSTSFHWITHLTLANNSFSRRDLLELSKLVNLGTLTIEGCSNDLCDDGVIRAWARAATEAGAFSMLRVLTCSFQCLTHNIFTHLSQLPVLSILLLKHDTTSEAEAQALKFGWNLRDLSEKESPLGPFNIPFGSFIQNVFHHSGPFGIDSVSEEGVQAINSLPVLRFSLGRDDSRMANKGWNNGSIDLFERTIPSRYIYHGNDSVQKRTIEEPTNSRGPRKRTMRNSRLEDLSQTLSGFV